MVLLDSLLDLVERLNIEVVDLWVLLSEINDTLLDLLLVLLQHLDVVNHGLIDNLLDIIVLNGLFVQVLCFIVSFRGILLNGINDILLFCQLFDVVNQDLSSGGFLILVQKLVVLIILLDLLLRPGEVHLWKLRLDGELDLGLGHIVNISLRWVTSGDDVHCLESVLGSADGELGTDLSSIFFLLGVDNVVIEVGPSGKSSLLGGWEFHNLDLDTLRSLTEVFLLGTVGVEG